MRRAEERSEEGQNSEIKPFFHFCSAQESPISSLSVSLYIQSASSRLGSFSFCLLGKNRIVSSFARIESEEQEEEQQREFYRDEYWNKDFGNGRRRRKKKGAIASGAKGKEGEEERLLKFDEG